MIVSLPLVFLGTIYLGQALGSLFPEPAKAKAVVALAPASAPAPASTPAPLTEPRSTADAKLDQVAAMLNLNGLLCAQVVNMRPIRQELVWEVTCIAYRGGSATKNYILNLNDGSAFEE